MSVCGIGYLGEGRYVSRLAGKLTREYGLWAEVIKRCHSPLRLRKDPQYLECVLQDSWYNFQNFAEWCNSQFGFNSVDEKGKVFQLDKDILIKGNKTYSEDTCVFVPQALNKLLTHQKINKGNYPTGVCQIRCNGRILYIAQVNNPYSSKKGRILGYFDNPDEAFMAYKSKKEEIIRLQASKFKDDIDSRVFNVLMNYEVTK